jgi:hypothetical protein
MPRPQFKNSKIRIMSSMSDSEQIGASFWFNIDDQELQKQLETYYAVSGKNPSMQFQRKVGDQYITTASANLFMPDERIAQLKEDAATKAPADENKPADGTGNEGEPNGFPTSE